jgi:hypothetical protein
VKKAVKVPAQVLANARAAAEQTQPKKPQPPPSPRGRRVLAREKVIKALKKLHPMD